MLGFRRCSAATVAIYVSVLTSPARAGIPTGGTIVFVPDAGPATAVPTIGGAMLILLAFMLAFAAFTALRNRSGSLNSVMLTACLLGSLVSAASGVSLVRRVDAAVAATPIVDAQGETLPIQAGSLNEFVNNAGVPMTVQAISLPPADCPPATATGGAGQCALNLRLEENASCEIDCSQVFQGSDIQLKADITAVGVAPNGLPLYRFRYRGGEQYYVGVMAQDVLQRFPEAVGVSPSGYLGVNYDALGLRMRAVD